MPTTPNYSFPYPALTNAPNVPADIQALASGLDTFLKAARPQPGAQAWQNGTSNITLNSSTFTAAIDVAVADPGYPYYLECGAQAVASAASLWTAGAPPLTNLQVTLDTVTGTLINSSQSPGGPTFAGAVYTAFLMPKKSGVLTGAHTVILSADSVTSLGGGVQSLIYSQFVALQTYLNVDIIPA